MTLPVILIALPQRRRRRAGVARARVDISRRLMQDKGKLLGTAMSGLQMIETLKATGSEGEFFARWAGYHARTMNTEQTLGVLSQAAAAVPPFAQTLSTAAVLVLGGMQVMNGELTVGMLVAYQTLLTSFTRPLSNFVQFGSMLQELQADMNRLDDVLRYPQDTELRACRPTAAALDPATAQALVAGSSCATSRSATARSSRPLIKDLSLRVEPGHRVAIVGASGSGKSHGREADRRALRAVVGPDPVRRRAAPRRFRAHVLTNSIGVRRSGHLPVPRHCHATT